MKNNELTQNQIVVEIRRISKNIQFFFWLTIASIGFSLITAIYLSSDSDENASNDIKKDNAAVLTEPPAPRKPIEEHP